MTNQPNPSYDYEKEFKIDVDINLAFDADVEIWTQKDVTIDIDVKSCVDLNGNTAELTLDVEAYGKNTDAEAIATVLTVDDKLSSISLWAFSAAN